MRKVDVAELKVGMYVSELDRPWRDTPFLFQGFEIRSQEEIANLQRLCNFVYIIDPDEYISAKPNLKARVAPAALRRAQDDPALSRRERYEFDLLRIANQPGAPPAYEDLTTLEEEVVTIKQDVEATRELIQSIMEDVRLGKNIDAIQAKRTVAALTESVIRNPDALSCFIQLKKKDEYTAQHSMRVCILALALGRHLGFNRDQLQTLGIGALLHDLGKMKVPNEILNKPARLTDYEFNLMKTHVPRGVEILNATTGIPPAAIEVARCHHERYSGGGYISGLKGEAIGLFGSIGGIVDCYDAITSDRAYHDGMSTHQALRKMYEWRSRDFHPVLVEQFIQCMGIYPIGSIVSLNTGDVGVVVTMNRIRRLKPRVVLVLKPDATPYPTPQTVDLMTHKTRSGDPCEIEHVLEPGIHGINPTSYLPLPASAFAALQ